MNLTQASLNLLRSQPHRTNLWLSIYRPTTIMSAVVTGTYDTGDRQITYIGASSSYLNLYPDMTVKIGTAAGEDDVGRLRVRSFTGTYIDFAENSINWTSGQYLTFINQIDVQAIYPRIIQDPDNDENVIFYKDYDIPYSTQNSVYGSFPNAGPHRAAFLSSGTASLYYTATGTYNVASSALTYLWSFEGGTPTGSTSLTPGNVNYSAAGHYRTKLRVSAANGGVDETHRYVSIYNRPNEGTNVPTLKWELQDLSGSRSEGGYTASFKVFENIGNIEPNALVVIFSDTWYGGAITSMGGNAQNASRIVFSGYILSDTIKFNYNESFVEFQVGSVSEIMKEAEGFSVSCESKASPSTWFELYEMTVPKAMYHYLRWHSTVLKVTDFQYTGDNRLVQYFDADRGSLFDAVDSFMRDGMLGAVVADRQGKLWAEISSFGLQTPFSSIPSYFTFHKQDWIGSPSITERRNSDLSFIEMGGIAFYGVSSNLFSAILTAAPSTVPLYHGKSERNDGLILVSQQQLNQIAGHFLAHHNTKFPEISLSLAGNYSNLDIAPLEQTRLVIDQNDSVRNKSIQDLPYVVEGMEWSYDARAEVFRPDVTLVQIATGTAGQTVHIPAVPPDGGFGYPDIDLPPLPEFPGATPIGPQVNTTVLFHDQTAGFVYCENFDSNSPNYITVNAGLTQNQYRNANFMFVCPNGAFYAGRCDAIEADEVGTNKSDSPFIARAPSIGGTFVVIEDENTLFAKYPEAPTLNHAIKACSYNPLAAETVAYIMGQNVPGADDTDHNIWIGSNGTYTEGANVTRISEDHGENGLSFGGNKWVYTGPKSTFLNPAARWMFNAAATTLEGADGANFGSINNVSHLRPSPNLTTLFILGGTMSKSTDNGVTWTTIDDGTYNGGRGLSLDPTGMFGMLDIAVAHKGRTTDGLATVTGLPNLPPANRYEFAYAGTTTRWIAAYAIIRFSPDGGGTWMNREGDFTSVITPIPSIDMIFVPGISQAHSQARPE